MTESPNAIEVAAQPATPWSQQQPASGPAQPAAPPARPLAEPRFATFYGVRQVGTSAYCTPTIGSDRPAASPTKGKPIRPFAIKPGPGAKVITTAWGLGGRGTGADTR